MVSISVDFLPVGLERANELIKKSSQSPWGGLLRY
jgi:hypothetical protein